MSEPEATAAAAAEAGLLERLCRFVEALATSGAGIPTRLWQEFAELRAVIRARAEGGEGLL